MRPVTGKIVWFQPMTIPTVDKNARAEASAKIADRGFSLG